MLTGDVAKAVDAVKAGKDPAVAVYGESGQIDSDQVIEADDVDARDSTSTVTDLLGDEAGENGSPTQAGKDTTETSGGDQKKSALPDPAGNLEEVVVSDDKGRRSVKIDFNNRDQLKKYVQQAFGMRKFQAERDNERISRQGLEKELGELKGHWGNIEKSYKTRGIAGLVDLIDGQGAFQRWEQQQQTRWETRKNATPEELALLDSREREQTRERELADIRRENEEFKKQVTSERETAEMRAVESRVHPVFEKYRFAGKLGSPDQEHRLDKMLWNSALESLEPYEAKGLEVTPEMITQAFRDESTALRQIIKTQVENKVKTAVQNKKTEATANAQVAAMKGVKNTSTAREATDLLKKGDITGLLKGWGKFGSVFQK